jgi:hypothetical protein
VFEDDALVRGTPGKALGTVKERHTDLMYRAAAFYVNRIASYKAAGLDDPDTRAQ